MHEPSLQDYMAVLRRRRRVVALSMLAALALAVVVSFAMTPTYEATSELLLQRTASEELLVDELGQVRSSADAEREINNEIRLIESQSVREAVEDRYDGPLDVDRVRASAASSDSNDVIDVSVRSADAGAATDLVNLYAETYIDVRRERQIDELLAASDEIQTRLDDLRGQIAEVGQPLDDINARIAAAPADSPERTELEDERNAILPQVLPELAPLQSRESALRGQLEQLQVTQDLAQAGGVEVLDAADEPSSPVSPNTVANVVVGGLIGLIGGIVVALLVDRLDDSVRSKETVEQITGLPTLGVIPNRDGASSSIDLVGLDDPTSPAAEAYRLLRTSVRFLGLDTPVRTILVTSAAASEGKTVTAANLAIALAQGDDHVLLVGADLRRPRVHELFGSPERPGLTSVLVGESTTENAVYGIEEASGLHLMPPGPAPPSPAELLDSERARELFASFAQTYDTVVIDSPPVLPVTDAQVLSRAADAVLFVVAHGETSKRSLARAIELLGQVDAPLVGTVLNVVPASEGYGGQAYRYDTYKSRSERRRQREAGAGPRVGRRRASLSPPAHLEGNGQEEQIAAQGDALAGGASAAEGPDPAREAAADEPR
jgi:polysaccharide biosynthesis transport protein